MTLENPYHNVTEDGKVEGVLAAGRWSETTLKARAYGSPRSF
jgi:hypothetical protein